jgi:hypothetical protein
MELNSRTGMLSNKLPQSGFETFVHVQCDPRDEHVQYVLHVSEVQVELAYHAWHVQNDRTSDDPHADYASNDPSIGIQHRELVHAHDVDHVCVRVRSSKTPFDYRHSSIVLR